MGTNFIVITGDNCPYCDKVKLELSQYGHTYLELNLYENPELALIMTALGARTVPQVLKVTGGHDSTVEHLQRHAHDEKLRDALRFLADQVDLDMAEEVRSKELVKALEDARLLSGECA